MNETKKLKSDVSPFTSNNRLDAAVEEILNRLFTNGTGENAKRLVLELETGHDGGGWCRGAVRDQIREVLQEGI